MVGKCVALLHNRLISRFAFFRNEYCIWYVWAIIHAEKSMLGGPSRIYTPKK